jgi:hypothetical protein
MPAAAGHGVAHRLYGECATTVDILGALRSYFSQGAQQQQVYPVK